ncbi:MAG: metallophosphoesterase family protein [Tepidisphaeraceae bacterium]
MRTIAHISDLHFGRVDDSVAEGLVGDLHAQSPNLVVASGDFTQRARAKQYAAARAFLGRLPKPQLVVPGNHDIPLWDVVRRFFFPLHRYRWFISKDLRPVHEDDQLLVIGINTARSFSWTWNGFWKDGKISEEQLLDVRLRACPLPHTVFKVVVTHHPFIPPPGERLHGIVRGAHRALARMEECGVDLCLAGHLHRGYSGDVRTHFEAVKRSIISVQAGTATSTRRREEPNAYNLITINPDQLSIAVRAWTGARFEQTERTHYARIDGVWQREG